MGDLVRRACQRHLDDLEQAAAQGWRWNQEEADRILSVFGLLPQYQGRWAGQPLELLPWQEFCIGSVFGWQLWNDSLNRWIRRFRTAYISIARKNGKSTTAGGVGIVLLDFDGEPAAQVYAIATKRDQAKQVWNPAQQMVAKSPALQRRIEHLKSTSRLIVRDTGSFFSPLGRDSDTEHGLNPSGALIDELHVHRDRSMVDAIETATGARVQPLIWYITTAGIEGASIYAEIDDLARRVVRGITDDPRMFVYLASLDPEDDWRDPAVYIKGNPSLGMTVQLDELIAERDKAMSTPGRQNSFKRLRLNMRTSSETAWLDIAKWDACQVTSLKRQGLTHIGVDLGGRQDLSAAARVTRGDDGGYDADFRFWMPADCVQEAEERDGVPYQAWIDDGYISATRGDYRDDARILEDLTEWRGETGAAQIDIDQWNSTMLTTPLQERGMTVVLVPQYFRELSPAVEAVESQINHGKLSHLENPVMRWMLTNAALEENRDGGRKPIKQDSMKHRRHIDGLAALLDAISQVIKAEPEEELYDGSDGLLFL